MENIFENNDDSNNREEFVFVDDLVGEEEGDEIENLNDGKNYARLRQCGHC